MSVGSLFQQEDLNFLLTNRIPRRYATRLMGWFSRIESRALTRLSLRAWKVFAPELDLSETCATEFRSLREFFIRELAEDARPIDPDPRSIVSPCDAVVGAHGRLRGTELLQAKGFPYRLEDLLPDPALAQEHVGGHYVTLRLKSTFYHRFHAPTAGRVREVLYVSGDTWNVNPIALERVERLFCRNERAVVRLEPELPNLRITLVPVAAILVASMKFAFLPDPLDLRYRGPNRIPCDVTFAKGDEIGYFQHGSTLLLFVSGDVRLAEGVETGKVIRMGQPLFFPTADLARPECAPR